LKSLLTSEIDFGSFELAPGLLKLSGQIKASPDARAEIRKMLEPDTGNLLAAANDVIGEAILRLGERGKRDLVVLMDDLDKMIVRPHGEAGCMTDEYLFINRSAQLTAFSCHVVYTIPLSLAYSHQEQAIKGNYGGHVPVVPMTRITHRPPSTEAHPAGIEKFRQIIARRLEAAGAKESEVFVSAEAQDALIRLSGGQPSELMSLVREALITHGLPIDEKSLARAEFEGRREYARQLREDHWQIIEEVRPEGSFRRTKEKDAAFRELLDSRAILQYVNDEEWYGLNPMVASLTNPAQRVSKP
jgi:hypothetical protein